MIEVQDLTKNFADKVAVDHVSFNVAKGEILGFLGPNGAGKTTTMRILTGYLPATQGTARVAGFDVANESLEMRRHIGYFPEIPPLYPDMSVRSYLDFVVRIKGVPAERRAACVDDALQKANVADKRNELIKRLSRGYKQRVGLAQALVHDPEVIILDEPTAGLDPKQIIEVRHLIKKLAGNHTIILSTHILPEVSMTCDRLVIINRGKIVASGSLDSLTHSDGLRLRLEVAAPDQPLRDLLRQIPNIRNVRIEPATASNRLVALIEAAEGKDVASQIAAKVVARGWALHEIRAIAPSLEDFYMRAITEDPAQSTSAN